MTGTEKSVVLYWDASAILSALLRDEHSKDAQNWSNQPGYHFISHLAYSEVLAVFSRIRRERKMAEVLVEAAVEVLEKGPWRRLHIVPPWDLIKKLSNKWPLRGADLWHLSAAKSFQDHLPELKVLTYDARLKIAIQGEEMNPEEEA
jgi:predicted nucleic acid-binding protein